MNGKLRWFACFLILMLILPSLSSLAMPDKAKADVYPANVYVDTNKTDDTGNGLSWATAKKFIQSGIGLTDPAGGGTVNVATGTYSLSGDGRIYIDHPLTLVGAGAATTIIDGSGLSSWEVVQIHPTGTVNISSFTVQHGYSWGGVYIYENSGFINFNDCIITGNYAFNNEGSYGGGIFIESGNTVTMNRCTVSGNHAGSAPFAPNPSGENHAPRTIDGYYYDGSAGGIFVDGSTLTLNACQLLNNTASSGMGAGTRNAGTNVGTDVSGSGGGMVAIYNSTVNMTGCTVIGNSASGTGYDVSGSGGGLVAVESPLTMTGCTVKGNRSSSLGTEPEAINGAGDGYTFDISGSGGGIVTVYGPLTMNNCTVRDNTATGNNDDLAHINFSGSAGGLAALFYPFKIDNNSVFDNNTATGLGGGIVYIGLPVVDQPAAAQGSSNLKWHSGRSLGAGRSVPNAIESAEISDFTITNNWSDIFGGGLFLFGSELTLNRGTIGNNLAGRAGGGLFTLASLFFTEYLSNQSAINNGGLPGDSGTYKDLGNFLTKGRQFARTGIGQPLMGAVTLNNCTVTNNQALNWGGGMASAFSLYELNGCTFSGNAAGRLGGGIGSLISLGELINCTISGNRLTYPDISGGFNRLLASPNPVGGNVLNSGTGLPTVSNAGGGMGMIVGSTFFECDTIANNTTGSDPDSYGGGLFNSRGTINGFVNTIVANNTAVQTSTNNCLNRGTIISLGHNIDSQNSDNFTAGGDQINTDPLLGQLQNNGGPTLTCAIGTDSPAYDKGDNSHAPSTDQRGVTRPQGTYVDIGAFELVPPNTPPPPPSTFIGSGTHGSSLPGTFNQLNFINLPNIFVTQASVSPASVAPGATVTVTATVENKGTVNGSLPVKLVINGQDEANSSVTVASGKTAPVSFTVSRSQPGSYTVFVGGKAAGSFTVEETLEPNIILFISAGLILVALVLGVIYLRGRRQYS